MENNTEIKTGKATAAVWGAGVAFLSLAIVQVCSEISPSLGKGLIHNIGKLWIPGASGIGPYSGKETIALVSWLVTWGIMYQCLKLKDVSMKTTVSVFLFLVGLATTLLWPPFWAPIAHLFGGGH